MKSTDVYADHVYLVRSLSSPSGSKGYTFAHATAKPTSFQPRYGNRKVNTVSIVPVFITETDLRPYRCLSNDGMDVEVARLTVDLGHVDDPTTLDELRRLATIENAAAIARQDANDARKAHLAATADLLDLVGIKGLAVHQVATSTSLLSVLRQAAAAGIKAEATS